MDFKSKQLLLITRKPEMFCIQNNSGLQSDAVKDVADGRKKITTVNVTIFK